MEEVVTKKVVKKPAAKKEAPKKEAKPKKETKPKPAKEPKAKSDSTSSPKKKKSASDIEDENEPNEYDLNDSFIDNDHKNEEDGNFSFPLINFLFVDEEHDFVPRNEEEEEENMDELRKEGAKFMKQASIELKRKYNEGNHSNSLKKSYMKTMMKEDTVDLQVLPPNHKKKKMASRYVNMERHVIDTILIT
jgi:hypothetical protein